MDMPDTQNVPAKDARMLIVGAGAAGLATAYFLKQNGYTNVTIFERLGRVGGKCRSITDGYHTYELGATYVGPRYREIRKLIRRMGATTHREVQAFALKVSDDDESPVIVRKVSEAIVGRTSWITFAWAIIRFVCKRWMLGRVIDRPTFSGIEDHPDLCVSFAEWLSNNRLEVLSSLFVIPLTSMGYGPLEDIPAPQGLKQIDVPTLAAGMLPILGWPKRVSYGYQRLWERVSWDLNVRLNVDIKKIERGEKVKVHFTHREWMMDEFRDHEDTFEFDHLILASPLTIDALEGFLDISEPERELFSQVRVLPYCLVTYKVDNLDLHGGAWVILPPPKYGETMSLGKEFGENNFTEFYCSLDPDAEIDKDKVISYLRGFLDRMGATPREDQWHIFYVWEYYPHVSVQSLREGFFTKIENLQGQRNTYYTGGLLSFENVECVVQHGKYVADTYFPKNR